MRRKAERKVMWRTKEFVENELEHKTIRYVSSSKFVLMTLTTYCVQISFFAGFLNSFQNDIHDIYETRAYRRCSVSFAEISKDSPPAART